MSTISNISILLNKEAEESLLRMVNQKQSKVSASDLLNNFIDETPIARQSELPYQDVGIARTPLVRAVTHLLKIGSTNKLELEQMAAEFVTEEAACNKLGFSYFDWSWNNFHGDYIDHCEKTTEDFKIYISSEMLNSISKCESSQIKYTPIDGQIVFGRKVVIDNKITHWEFK